jgi:hypothetical protein
MYEYLRLGVGGLLLNEEVYRQQRDDPNGLRRGFVLVLIVGLLVGMASTVGYVVEWLARPESSIVEATIYDGLTAMPWYLNVSGLSGFPEQFRETFEQGAALAQLMTQADLLMVGITPLAYLLTWVSYGLFTHLVARSFGGKATLRETLRCTALAVGANLLALVQLVPFAQVSGSLVLALAASYIAVREAHGLRAVPAFWATMLAPIVLLVVLVVAVCGGLFMLSNTF